MTTDNHAEQTEYRIHQLFEVGVLLKGLNAVVETGLGLLLFFVDVRGIVETFINNELIDDPNDYLATHLQSFTDKLSPGAELYSALYLLSHGIVKGFLVWGLLREKIWAYPASMAVLVLFIIYQVVKFLENHSIGLALLTAFDLVILWLIWHEYRVISAHLGKRKSG